MESSQNILTRYNDFQNKRVRPEDYVKQYSNELGVDQIRGRVNEARSAIRATENTIAATPGSVAGRTSGSLVGDAQRTALVQQEIAPLQEIMGTQVAGFGDANAELESVTSQANNRASMAYGADSDQANNLLGLYNAALGWEAEQERKRQFEENMRLERDKMVAAQRAAAASRPSPSVATPKDGGGSTPTNPVQQKAYNEVKDRVTWQSPQDLISDFNATLKSANYGNPYDQAKVEIYRQLRPDLFSSAGQSGSTPQQSSKSNYVNPLSVLKLFGGVR